MENNIPDGGDILIKSLETAGIRHIFGLSGGAALPIFDALTGSSPNIEFVLVRLAESRSGCDGHGCAGRWREYLRIGTGCFHGALRDGRRTAETTAALSHGPHTRAPQATKPSRQQAGSWPAAAGKPPAAKS